MVQEKIQKRSWYQSQHKFSLDEQYYLETIAETFRVRAPDGSAIDYEMTDYQREFHAASLNVKGEEAEDILFIKARGISFSFSSLIDLIMTGLMYRNQMLPIITQRLDRPHPLLEVAKWLILNAKADLGRIEIMEGQIKFLETNSVMKPFPSGSAANAVRSTRLIRALVDEFAFQSHDKELLTAVQDTMQSKLSQIIIGSTPCGMNNHFFRLIKNPIGFNVFRLPVFDEKKFNPHKSIMEQGLIAVAPWIDLGELEKKRLRDVNIFMQEQMCDFLDDTIAFIPFSLVKRCERENLVNYYDMMRKNPNFIYETTNPVFIGVDVARTTHLTAISVFEHTKNEDGKTIFIQRYLQTFRGVEIPKQVEIIDRLINRFPSIMQVRIDMTGLGLGLYEYLHKKFGEKVRGIQFASGAGMQTRIRTGEVRQKTKIRDYMIVNLKQLMEGNQVELLIDENQEKHLTSVNYELKVKEDESGHGDILFADALALLPHDYSVIAAEPLITGTGSFDKKPEIPKDPKTWSLQDRVNWLKSQRRIG
jgi:phage FluMu gp28-like protein